MSSGKWIYIFYELFCWMNVLKVSNNKRMWYFSQIAKVTGRTCSRRFSAEKVCRGEAIENVWAEWFDDQGRRKQDFFSGMITGFSSVCVSSSTHQSRPHRISRCQEGWAKNGRNLLERSIAAFLNQDIPIYFSCVATHQFQKASLECELHCPAGTENNLPTLLLPVGKKYRN